MADRFSGQTGVIPYTSALQRKAWLREGLVPIMETTFWAPFIGNSKTAAIYQKNDFGAGNGNNIIFDFDGFLSNEGMRGKEQARGKGETKKKFSNSLTIERGRYVAHNGDEFDLENINAIDLSQHSDSRTKLAALWAKNKDQRIFDIAQGFADAKGPTHVWRPNHRATVADLTAGDEFTYDTLLEIELACRTGQGFAQGRDRLPLLPVSGNYGGRYTMVIDAYMEAQLRSDSDWQNIMMRADVRGQKNRLIQGYIGSVGLLDIVTASSFFGSSSSNKQFKTSTVMPGMRSLSSDGKFQGEAGFNLAANKQISRAIVLGQSGMQIASGKHADFKLKESEDFDIDSESAIIVYSNGQRTSLKAETEDYQDASQIGGIDFGMFNCDFYIKG